jgi:hypothetical protein
MNHVIDIPWFRSLVNTANVVLVPVETLVFSILLINRRIRTRLLSLMKGRRGVRFFATLWIVQYLVYFTGLLARFWAAVRWGKGTRWDILGWLEIGGFVWIQIWARGVAQKIERDKGSGSKEKEEDEEDEKQEKPEDRAAGLGHNVGKGRVMMAVQGDSEVSWF